jgi:hypothetical protein
MNFPSKLTIAIAAASIICPIAANASPVVSTGSTAAAVSIKFQSYRGGPTNGNFTMNPGTNASGGGSGVQELSAAVATAETKATAESSSSRSGTKATAKGYSAPVSFKYTTNSDVSNSNQQSEYAYRRNYKGKESKVTSDNDRDTTYEYKGTSAGLSFIPAIPK